VKLPAVFLASLLLCPVPLLLAQGPKTSKPLPPSAFKLISIRVSGSSHYAPAEVAAAAGLHLGQTVSESDFKKASQNLGETGVFSNVAYAFQFSPEGTKLDLEVTDGGPLVPARFENFVWLPDEELLQQLRAHVPLFHGQLPVGGGLPDQVADALEAVLIEHKVQGRIDYLRAGPAEGPIEAFVFTVASPAIHIRHVEIRGATATELPLLQAAAKSLQNHDYLRSFLRVQAEKNLVPIYLERGYLKAAFSEAQPKIVEDTPQEMLVDVTLPVNPGQQYTVSDLEISGYKAFPDSDKLRALIHQRPGQPANGIELNHDLESLKKLYGRRGYMAASIRAEPQFDDAHSAVSYVIQINEGDVYKMGELEIEGLDTRTTARLADAWKIRGGDPYDSSYAKKFLEDVNPLLPGGQWNISMHESVEESDKSVDVTLRFDPKLTDRR
jgi:outer membrane protein assembly factor BamA